jgi:hypothetical protein
MQARKRVLGFVCVTAVLVLLSGTTTFALTARYGANSSYDYDNITRVAACDGESDSTTVYADYEVQGGATGRIYDQDGSAGGCTGSAKYTRIHKHKVCEDLKWAPDDCSTYVYP